mgnify:CR=1 FL=1
MSNKKLEEFYKAYERGDLRFVKKFVLDNLVNSTHNECCAINLASCYGHLDVVDIVVRRAALLSQLDLHTELSYLIGEFTWGPGAGIYFLKDKPIGATNIIRQLKNKYL